MTVLTQGEKALLQSFHLTPAQKAEVWAAWQESPEGTETCCLRARAQGRREGRSGAGLLLTMIRAGEHVPEPYTGPERRITGYRMIRGTHGATYVRDPRGTDPLPEGYAF